MKSFRYFLILMISVLSVSANAKVQEAADTLTIREVFSSLKDESLDLLPVSTRLDMLDYYDADSIFKARNAMSGMSELVKVTPDYLKVKITDASNLQIKLLPLRKGGTLVMTIYTVGGDKRSADSEIKFFDSSLNPLSREKYLSGPDLKDFFSIDKGSRTNMKEIRGMVPFPTIEFTAEPGETDMRGHLTVGEYISQDDYNILKLFLKPSITMVWKGDKYKFEK